LSINGWWLLLQGAVWSLGVIVLLPSSDDVTRMVQAAKPVQVEAGSPEIREAQLMVTLVADAPKPLGRTWTDAEYAVRDAHLAALGVRAFRRMH